MFNSTAFQSVLHHKLVFYSSSQASNGFGLLDDLVSKIVDEDQSVFGYANGSLSSDSSHESRANSDMFAYDR